MRHICLFLLLIMLAAPHPSDADTLTVTLAVWPPDTQAEVLDNYGRWVKLGTVSQPIQWNTEWNHSKETQVRLTAGGEAFTYAVPIKQFTATQRKWSPPQGPDLPISWALRWHYMAVWYLGGVFLVLAAVAGLATIVRRGWARAALEQVHKSIDPWIGRMLGRYKLESRLGEGGMATVYRAVDPASEEVVALKLLRKGLAESQEFCARFQREVRLLTRLSHPSIIRVYDYSSPGESVLWYSMELVAGGTLRDNMRSLVGKPMEILRVLRPVFEGVAYAHTQGVVHRDLKPENILLLAEGGVKVMDFGVARATSDTLLTQTGAMIGTPRYFPPETLSTGGPVVDPRSDQYSLGVMTYELLTGRPPFDAEDLISLVVQHQSEPPPPLRELLPSASSSLEETLHRMMEKSPKDRFPDLLDALTAIESAILA